MSTLPAVPPSTDAVTARRWAQLEAFAAKQKLSVDDALQRALDIASVVLDAKTQPGAEFYLFVKGERYGKLDLYPLDPQ